MTEAMAKGELSRRLDLRGCTIVAFDLFFNLKAHCFAIQLHVIVSEKVVRELNT